MSGNGGHLEFPIDTKIKYFVKGHLKRRILKLQPIRKHNWSSRHIEFPNKTKITNNVDINQSNTFTKSGSICSCDFRKKLKCEKPKDENNNGHRVMTIFGPG